jgi:hypothetical protein
VTRQLPAGVQALGRALEVESGTYLYSAVRERQVTCAVCAAPVDGYDVCVPCGKWAKSGAALADRVGSLLYAVEPDSQAYRLVRNYKAARPGPSHKETMRALLALGLGGHSPPVPRPRCR